MVRLKRILCAVDKSKCSTEALAYAVHFALKSFAELCLLHVIDTRHFDDFPPFEFPGPESEAVTRINNELTAKVSEEVRSKIKADVVVTTSVPVRKILSVARERGIGMIVMGAHGRTDVASGVMGSVEVDVLRKADCPVLTVRQSD